MVLSDRTIKTLLAEGKIVVEPLGEGCHTACERGCSS